MIALLLAAALSAATPTTPPPATTDAEKVTQIIKDAPLVCSARFIEEMKIQAAGLKDHKPVVIDVYAAKTGLSPELKLSLESHCNFFDLGAVFVLKTIAEQQQQGPNGIHRMGRPTDKIASLSFTH